jgi:hypothetical protein
LLVKRKNEYLSKLEIKYNENNSDSCPLCFHDFRVQDLGGKTVILRTYEAAVHTYLFDDVL